MLSQGLFIFDGGQSVLVFGLREPKKEGRVHLRPPLPNFQMERLEISIGLFIMAPHAKNFDYLFIILPLQL